MIKNLKISTRKIGFRKSWKIMCAVAKCKNKKFSLFSTFAVVFSCSSENFISNVVNFKFFSRLFFLFRLFFHPTSSEFSNVRFFFVAGCLRVPKGCLRGARFARNFFEKSFNSYLELEPPQHSVTRRGTFWRAARAERSAH